jgi:hypothetical protein
MNERIRELAKRAGGNPNYKAFRGHFLPPPPDYIDPATVNLEKFAELIVQECMELALREQKRYANITHRNMSECVVALGNFSLLIKDHFEDEE